MIQIKPINAFNDNYIWLISTSTSIAAVVDPGDAQPVIDALQREQLQLTDILVTHHHQDHVGGIAELQQLYPQVQIHNTADHNKDVKILHNAISLHTMEVPGHTLDHIAFYNNDSLFCGDTLFSAGCGRVFEGTPEQMHHSLQKLAALPDTTKVYCAHEYTLANLAFAETVEPNNKDIQNHILQSRKKRDQKLPTLPTTIGIEKKINPFLRTKEPSVIASAKKHCNCELATPTEVFAAIRQWKDIF